MVEADKAKFASLDQIDSEIDLNAPEHRKGLRELVSASGKAQWAGTTSTFNGGCWYPGMVYFNGQATGILHPEVYTYRVNVNGLPAGTTAISAWVSESVGGGSHAGQAIYYTYGVQLFNNGTLAAVYYGIKYSSAATLPSLVSLIYY